MTDLSPQQETIVKYLTRGFTNKEIAREMGLSVNTVKLYLHRIYQKAGVGSRRFIARQYEAHQQ